MVRPRRNRRRGGEVQTLPVALSHELLAAQNLVNRVSGS
jgi:hypothetical protein